MTKRIARLFLLSLAFESARVKHLLLADSFLFQRASCDAWSVDLLFAKSRRHRNERNKPSVSDSCSPSRIPTTESFRRRSTVLHHDLNGGFQGTCRANASSTGFCDDDSDDTLNSSTTSSSTNMEKHKNKDYSKIRKGEIYVERGFLTPSQVAALREDIAALRKGYRSVEKTTTTTTSKGTKFFFKPSGLSNRVKGDQNIFGSSDRLTCTITPDLLLVEEDHSKHPNVRLLVEKKMEDVKRELEAALSPNTDASSCNSNGHHNARPTTMEDTAETEHQNNDPLPYTLGLPQSELELELAEMYYSISPGGSHLPRHQDERHEETKGTKGWINETRRSVSWLIYLNEDGWGRGTEKNTRTNASSNGTGEGSGARDAGTTQMTYYKSRHGRSVEGHGGELRAYCRKCCSEEYVLCGSNEGNLQVGWLRIESPSSSSSSSTVVEYEPVFLDSWVKTKALENESGPPESNEEAAYSDDTLEWKAMSALYRIRRDGIPSKRRGSNNPESSKSSSGDPDHDENPRKAVREYLSPPFGPNSPSWPSEQILEPTDFAEALALQLSQEDQRSRFVGVEDIVPHRGGIDDDDIGSGMSDGDSQTMEIVDVVPKGGTLVLFDSVTVPHEVLEVTKGTRLAIAGWFHEGQQDFPEWYGT